MKSSEFNKLIEQRRPLAAARRAQPADGDTPNDQPHADQDAANCDAGDPSPSARLDFDDELYRPRKTPVTIRLDADVLDWFKRNSASRGYQTEINRVLRLYVAELEKSRARA